MKKTLYVVMIAALPAMLMAGTPEGRVCYRDVEAHRSGGRLTVSARMAFDSLRLGGDDQMVIVPQVRYGDTTVNLPGVLVNGRNMQYGYERGIMGRDLVRRYGVKDVVRRHNGREQNLEYLAQIPLDPSMVRHGVEVAFLTDTCGCGTPSGRGQEGPFPFSLNPVSDMHVAYVTPEVTELPVSVYEGRARVQFEVDRTVLHPVPYVCRNGQRIDNRAELKTIDDTVSYALSNPNVEIARITVTGLASPESPYLHNEELATGRSRALAEYLAGKYSLPMEKVAYDAVPENWGEFRTLVTEAADLTDEQRRDLLQLIDRPAYGPSDYDAKEKELKTSPAFRDLYRSRILPHWFPKLRATRFAINTRLKPLDDPQLAEIIKTSPELMSLNQMFRVALLYPEGSPEFNDVIATALKFYPDDPVANMNAAVTAVKEHDYDKARTYVSKAGDTPEARNLRGVIATFDGELDRAGELFRSASELPEAQRNLQLLEQ